MEHKIIQGYVLEFVQYVLYLLLTIPQCTVRPVLYGWPLAAWISYVWYVRYCKLYM